MIGLLPSLYYGKRGKIDPKKKQIGELSVSLKTNIHDGSNIVASVQLVLASFYQNVSELVYERYKTG